MNYNEWKEYNLDEVYGFASGLSKKASEFGSGFPFLSFKDVFYNYFVPTELENLANTTDKERLRCSVNRGDVFLTRTSETLNELGMSCVALKDYPNASFNGFTKRLRSKDTVEIHPEYAGYYFRSLRFRSTITSMSTMTTRASLNNDMLSILKITVPPIQEQKAIANILSSLDEKIELNNQMNKTLEEMAQALFKRWFVDFEFP
ncbi:MAG: restriction endonuclease subunit S, partial [Cellulosilyticaceae bacterium]